MADGSGPERAVHRAACPEAVCGSLPSGGVVGPAQQLDQYVDAAAGGLPAETVSIGYDNAADPVDVTSSQGSYVSALSYTELGQPQEYQYGTSAAPPGVACYRNARAGQAAGPACPAGGH
jgi:hypothetical protein